MRNVRVLSAENHTLSLDALKYMLETAGFEICQQPGRRGLSILIKQHIDGVLFEYDLPDATGSAVRAALKRIGSEVPVLRLRA